MLRAAARAHVRTGVPIMTHTDPSNQGGLDQQAIFAEEGVDPGAVVIGHCNWTTDLGYLEKLIGNGSSIGFDRCGMAVPGADLDQQRGVLVELCRRGHASKIVLGHDQAVYVPILPKEVLDAIPDGLFGYIGTSLLPQLRADGVSEADIHAMLVDNPRAFFSRRT